METIDALLICLGFILSLIGVGIYAIADTRTNRAASLLMIWGGSWLGIIGVWLGV